MRLVRDPRDCASSRLVEEASRRIHCSRLCEARHLPDRQRARKLECRASAESLKQARLLHAALACASCYLQQLSRPSTRLFSSSKLSQAILQRAGTCVLAGLAAFQFLHAAPADAFKEPFLSSTGAKGLLAEEEERLFRLRQEIEGEAQQELNRARLELEEQGRESQNGKLCATPFGVDVVGITEFIALTGALVGGFSARQRKDEVERLNEQLRKINLSLRQQARSGTIYAPGLTYAPAPTFTRSNAGSLSVVEPRPPQESQEEESNAPTATIPMTASVMPSMDEEDLSAEQQQCLMALREGKRLLKQQHGASAMVRFEKALMLAKSMGQKIYERRATRGLAAAARLQNQPQRAIEHLKRVLEISKEVGDHRGDADVHGTIADILTSLGDFSEAANYYDKYIQGLASGSDTL